MAQETSRLSSLGTVSTSRISTATLPSSGTRQVSSLRLAPITATRSVSMGPGQSPRETENSSGRYLLSSLQPLLLSSRTCPRLSYPQHQSSFQLLPQSTLIPNTQPLLLTHIRRQSQSKIPLQTCPLPFLQLPSGGQVTSGGLPLLSTIPCHQRHLCSNPPWSLQSCLAPITHTCCQAPCSQGIPPTCPIRVP